MTRVLALLRTTVGRKVLMAVTGLGLIGFLLVHMIGNLYVFQGQEDLNAYAAWLKANPLLWPARIGLLATFALHVWLGISLARENRAARPERYRNGLAAPAHTLASRSMIATGMLVLFFVVFHLAHFTLGYVQPEAYAEVDAQGRHDVYGMVLAGFRSPWIVGVYAVAMSVLAVHLYHAGQSFLQTLGVRYQYGNGVVRNLGLALVAVIAAGNLALPVLVFLGFAGGADVTAVATAGAGTP